MEVKSNESLRLYHFSDGHLIVLARSIASCLTRDLAELAHRGVTQDKIDELLAMQEAFAEMPTDPEFLGEVTVATEAKLKVRDNILAAARRLRTAAFNTYGEKARKYKRFGFEKMDKLTEDKLPRIAKKMVRLGNMFQVQLAAQGVDATFLNAFAALIPQYYTALDNVDIAEEIRDIESEKRVDSGNELYREITRFAAIGKDVLAPISEARYNDYVVMNKV
jgi:hypothetical protein